MTIASSFVLHTGSPPEAPASGKVALFADELSRMSVKTSSGTVSLMAATPGKNILVNGGMQVAQRGASFVRTSTAHAEYMLDQWQVNQLGTTITRGTTVTQSTTVPSLAVSGCAFANSLLVSSTATQTTLSADGSSTVRAKIEGWRVMPFYDGNLTLSFWVRSSTTGVYCVSVRNLGVWTRSYIAEYTIQTAGAWEYKTITFPFNGGGTWNTGTTGSMAIDWAYGMGSDFISGTAGSWLTGNYASTSGQTNIFATSGGYFGLTGVKLEYGSSPTPFEVNDVGVDLGECQRYLWKSYDCTVTPGTAGASAGSIAANLNGGGWVGLSVRYPVEMRVAPAVVLYNSTTGASGTWRDSGGTDRSAFSINSASGGLGLWNTSAFATNSTISGHIVSSAEV